MKKTVLQRKKTATGKQNRKTQEMNLQKSNQSSKEITLMMRKKKRRFFQDFNVL